MRGLWEARTGLAASAFLLMLVALIAPWAELPVNDDWLYAHVARNLAEKGILAIDVPVASTVVGQALIAWPVIRIFGFSHLALRLTTLALSVLILLELDYLLSRAGVTARVRLLALALLVATPFFLHFSTSFMTEHYGYVVALLAPCIWFRGQQRARGSVAVLSAAIAGCAFWIRQVSALVFPALLIAEFIVVDGGRARNIRKLLARRFLAIGVWIAFVAAYFVWASVSGNVTRQFSEPLVRSLVPDPLIFLVELGVFMFYMTFFFAPFLLAHIRREKLDARSLLVPVLLVLTAAFALRFGDSSGSPRANLSSTFPFLHNLFTKYGVGPITLTDVYWSNSQVRPRISNVPWLVIEALAIVLSVAWPRVIAAAREQKNEIGIFGISFSLLAFVVVALTFQSAIFDRYHYPGVLGCTLALAVLLPAGRSARLERAAVVWIAALALFSTFGLHDYFRWNEARADLVAEAQRRGIALSQLDGGYEVNGWNDVEGLGVSPDCGLQVFWFCGARRFRIGVERQPSERLILSHPVNSWLTSFPDLKLLDRDR